MAETKLNSGPLKSTTCELESSGQGNGTQWFLLKHSFNKCTEHLLNYAPGSILSAGDSVLEDTEETKISILTELSFSKLKHLASPSGKNPQCPG